MKPPDLLAGAVVVTASLLAGRPILLSAAGLTIVFASAEWLGCRLRASAAWPTRPGWRGPPGPRRSGPAVIRGRR